MSTLDNTVFDTGSESQDNSPSYGFGRSFLSSLGTGLLNFGLNQISAHQQRKWQEQMWHKQNQYNTPLAQANRMRAAGLNPYQEMGSIPAGSAGTGTAGAPANVRDPLELLSVFAEVDNLNASTGKIETESEKILRDISLLDLALERGWIEFEDYKKRIDKLWQAYESTGETPETAGLKKDIAQAREAETGADLNEANEKLVQQQEKTAKAQEALAEAMRQTEDNMREAKVALARAQKAHEEARANEAFQHAQKLKAEGKAVEQENERKAYIKFVGDFYGIDLFTLPPGVANEILTIYDKNSRYWNSLGYDENSAQVYNASNQAVYDLIKNASEKDTSIYTTDSSGYSWSFFGLGSSNNYSTAQKKN